MVNVKRYDIKGNNVKYGLPEEVIFCKKCVLSNQRPNPTQEHKFNPSSKKETAGFDEDGVCYACRFSELKDNTIDWDKREQELITLCNEHRSTDDKYDCVIPGSGGKDSAFTAHILKTKYNMHPLTVTWAPHLYTDIGHTNFDNWIHSGFDNILITPNGKIHRLLTKLAFENLLHPFQPFVFGQRYAGIRIAKKFNIPLVFHGESPFEYSGKSLNQINQSGFDNNYFISDTNVDDVYLGGVKVSSLINDYGLNMNDLNLYLPFMEKDFTNFELEYKFLGYYLKWDPQEVYYYASKNCNFEANPERTEGTYSKYASLDDKIDGFHYYTSFIKYGLGRATMDAAQEIRNKKITREEGIALVKKYDGEFPKKYFKTILDYIDITEEYFWELIDKARSPHLWEKNNNDWVLKKKIY